MMAAERRAEVDHRPPGEHAVVRAERHHQQHRQERHVRARRAGTDHEGRLPGVLRPGRRRRRVHATTRTATSTTVELARSTSALPDDPPHVRPASPADQHRSARQHRADVDLRRGRPARDATRTRSNNVTTLHLRPRDADEHDHVPRHRRRDAGLRCARAAAERDGPARSHDDARVRRQPQRDEADERARRGDDGDVRRSRQPDVGDRPDRHDAHDVQRPEPADHVHRPPRSRRRRSNTTTAACPTASPTSSARGSRSRTPSRACR